jgi:hypothetical protein
MLKTRNNTRLKSRLDKWQAQNGICILCGAPIDLDLDPAHAMGATFEHILPRSLLRNSPQFKFANHLALSHGLCNNKRGSRRLSEVGIYGDPDFVQQMLKLERKLFYLLSVQKSVTNHIGSTARS